MREIFLKRILCLFKKVNHDEEHQPRSTVRIGLDQAHDASGQGLGYLRCDAGQDVQRAIETSVLHTGINLNK